MNDLDLAALRARHHRRGDRHPAADKIGLGLDECCEDDLPYPCDAILAADRIEALEEALRIIAASDNGATDAIRVTARNIARAALGKAEDEEIPPEALAYYREVDKGRRE